MTPPLSMVATPLHTGERPFICQICEKRFTRVTNIRSHEQMHTEVSRFICQICEKRLTRASYLRTHILIHTGERSFECQLCDKSFTQASNLHRHKRHHCTQRCEQTEMKHVRQIKICLVYVCCECDQLFLHRFNTFIRSRMLLIIFVFSYKFVT